MKNCNMCGAQLEDYVQVCPYCGSNLQPDMQGGYAAMNQPGMQGGYTPMNQPDMQGGYAAMNQPDMQGGYTAMNQPGMQGGYTAMNQPGMQGGYMPMNQPDMQGGYTPERQPKQKKEIDKKKIIIPIVSVTVAVIAFLAVWLIFFAGKLTKRTAQKTLENYAMQIERKDVKGVLYRTVPRNLLARLFDDYGDGYDFDDFEESLDYGLYNYELQNTLDDAKIRFSNIKVKDIEAFDVAKYFKYMNGQLKKAGVDTTIEELILNETGEDGITVDEVQAKFEAALAMYNIDPDDMYLVDLSFDVSVKATVDYEDISGTYNSADLYADRAILYKYEDQWYVIPPVEGAVLPSLDQYMGKSLKSQDISSAKIIKTAVETSLGSERIYTELIENYSNQLIYVTEEGLAVLPDDVAAEIKSNIGEKLPEVKYTENGAKNFAFEINSYASVYIYIVGEDEEEDIWEICPEVDAEYY